MNSACLILIAFSCITMLSHAATLSQKLTAYAAAQGAEWRAEFCDRSYAELSALAQNIAAAATVLKDPVVDVLAMEWRTEVEMHVDIFADSTLCAASSQVRRFHAVQQFNHNLPRVWPNWVVKRSEVGV